MEEKPSALSYGAPCVGSCAFAPQFLFPEHAGSWGMYRGDIGNFSSQKGQYSDRVADVKIPVNPPTIQSPPHHAKQATIRPLFPAWLQLRMLPWQMKHTAESVSRISRHPHSAAPPQSIPLACSASSARAFVKQITSKCLPLRRGETKKHRFIPGSARNLKKAATPL